MKFIDAALKSTTLLFKAMFVKFIVVFTILLVVFFERMYVLGLTLSTIYIISIVVDQVTYFFLRYRSKKIQKYRKLIIMYLLIFALVFPALPLIKTQVRT